MKNKLSTLILVSTLAFSSTALIAGEWIKGYGESITEALTSAQSLAEAKVKTSKHGCVEGKTQNLQAQTISGTKVWSVEIFTSNHDGSCGIDKWDEWIKETSADLAKTLAK